MDKCIQLEPIGIETIITASDYIVDISDKTFLKIDSNEGQWIRTYLSPGYMCFYVKSNHRLLRSHHLNHKYRRSIDFMSNNDATVDLFGKYEISADEKFLIPFFQ